MWLPARSLDVVAELGLDPDDDAVAGVVAAVGQADVLDGRLADQLDAVAPAAAVEVVEPALPLGEQVGRRRAGASAARSSRPRRPGPRVNSARRGWLDHVGRERRVVLGGLGGGELDAALALGRAPARRGAPWLLRAAQNALAPAGRPA